MHSLLPKPLSEGSLAAGGGREGTGTLPRKLENLGLRSPPNSFYIFPLGVITFWKITVKKMKPRRATRPPAMRDPCVAQVGSQPLGWQLLECVHPSTRLCRDLRPTSQPDARTLVLPISGPGCACRHTECGVGPRWPVLSRLVPLGPPPWPILCGRDSDGPGGCPQLVTESPPLNGLVSVQCLSGPGLSPWASWAPGHCH